jgi:hypothetical protein
LTGPAKPERTGRAGFWRDADSRVVIGQAPNLPLIAWLSFTGLSRIPGSGRWHSAMSFTSTAFLFTWAYLELTHGVNYFRRLVGLIVLAAVIGSHLH